MKRLFRFLISFVGVYKKNSRMRTIRCSGRGGGVVCPGRVSAQGGCLPWGVSAQGGCLSGVSAQGGVHPRGPEAHTPHPREQNHRQVQRHYLSAATVVDSKNHLDLQKFIHQRCCTIISEHWREKL